LRLQPTGFSTVASKQWYDDNCIDEANPKAFVCQQKTSVQDACSQYTNPNYPGGGFW